MLLPFSISVNAEWLVSAGLLTRFSNTQSNLLPAVMNAAGLVPGPGEQQMLKLIYKGRLHSFLSLFSTLDGEWGNAATVLEFQNFKSVSAAKKSPSFWEPIPPQNIP